MTDTGPTRRRGAALEAAIMDAAWQELEIGGYGSFTFQAVASRAGTSRAVLYRRWETRAALASSAIARHIELNPVSVPDLGNLREELCLLLRKFADRAPPRLLGLVFEMANDMSAGGFSFLDARFQGFPLKGIIDRAVQRGYVDQAKLTPRVWRLPLSLVTHEAVITGKQISDEAISEIIDEVFLPLILRT